MIRITDQRAWVKSCLGVAEALRTLTILTLEKCHMQGPPCPPLPAWARTCFDRYWSVAYKKATPLDETREPNVQEKGQILGFMMWYRDFLGNFETLVDKLPKFELSEENQKKVEEAFERALNIDDLLTPEEQALGDSIFEQPEIASAEAAAKLATVERSQFYAALAEGNLGPSGAPDGTINQTDATEIYLLIFLGWHDIFDFRSSTQLRNHLIARLGINVVGRDPKRIEQLCRRIGLRFKRPGRPKKYLHRR